MAALTQQIADAAERKTGLRDKDDISLGISRSPDLEYEKNAYGPVHCVDLPKFSGGNKAEYEPWRAAFVSIVDVMDIPVGEKDFKAV